MAGNRAAARFHPGHYVRRHLEARNWSQVDLADVMQRPTQVLNEIIAGKRSITPETAVGLSQAFGTTPDYWLNLQTAFDLSQVATVDPAVAQRAVLYSKAPVKEMVRRGWISDTRDPTLLQKELEWFLELHSIKDIPAFYHAARKGTPYYETTSSQVAWLFGAKHVAENTPPPNRYSRKALESALEALGDMLPRPESVVRIPGVLADAGLKFIIVEPLPQTRIDGATFWLDRHSPVVALSIRYDRLDHFWYTLAHELWHVLALDGLEANEPLDLDLVGQQAASPQLKPKFEQAADEFAARSLVPQHELEAFIAQSRPLYSRARIIDFARSINVHPGIVVGQLQHRHEIQFSHSRDLLVKVRDLITETAETDGWGKKHAVR